MRNSPGGVDEANLSTEQPQKKEATRIQGPHGYGRRSQDHKPSAQKEKIQIICLGWLSRRFPGILG